MVRERNEPVVSGVLCLAPTRSIQLNAADGSYAHDVITPSTAQVLLTVGTDGNVTITGNSPTSYQWLLGGNASDYDVRFATVSGVPTSGTADTWQQLNSNRSVSAGQIAVGTAAFSFTLEFSLTGAATAIESGTVSLTATVYDS